MQDLLVSMMRFSAALTLFGMEQVQHSLGAVEDKENFSKTAERFEKALDSMTDVLVERIDEKKKETLKSVTKMSEDVVGKTTDGVKLDQHELFRATTDLIQKTTEATASLISKAASTVGKAGKSTKPAEEPAEPTPSA
jgi:hypothetical protein